MATSDGSARNRAHPRGEDSDEGAEPAETPGTDSHKRAAEVVQETDDLLDDIDETLRASLGLDKDADEELFAERATAMVAGYQQKGGQ